ncbi:MAG: hypothetical protein WBG69_02425, partial [Arcobacteraceae bacterium]
MQSLSLFTTNKERQWFLLLIVFLFSFNVYLHYIDFKKFTHNEIFSSLGTISNIYKKENYDVLKIKTANFVFFTSTQKQNDLNKFDK